MKPIIVDGMATIASTRLKNVAKSIGFLPRIMAEGCYNTIKDGKQVARMERSEIRGRCVAYEKPGLRCAPSGLRLLRLLESSRIPMSDWAPVFLLPNLRFK